MTSPRARKRMEEEQQRISELVSLREELSREVGDLGQTVNTLKEEHTTLSGRLVDAQVALSQAEESRARQEAIIQTFKEGMAELQAQIRELERGKNTITEQIIKLKDQHKAFEKVATTSKSAVNAALQWYQEEIDVKKHAIQVFKDEVKHLEADKKDVEAYVTGQLRALEKTRKEIAAERADIQRRTDRLEQVGKDTQILRERLKQFAAEKCIKFNINTQVTV